MTMLQAYYQRKGTQHHAEEQLFSFLGTETGNVSF